MSDLAKFRIETDAMGMGTIQVNDRDVTGQITAWTIQNRLGQPPLLVLNQILGGGVIEGEGIVRVEGAGQADAGAAVQAFLDSVDAMELEKAVLGSMGFGDEGSSMDLALSILKRWAAGDHSPA